MQYEIIVGSMLGATEYVADAIKDELASWGHQATIHIQPSLSEVNLSLPWIVCTSTHGAGDLPDNIQAFADQCANADLKEVNYIAIGLGDSSYDTFCEGVKKLSTLLQQNQAKALCDPLLVDVLEHPIPEDVAVDWLSQQRSILESM